MLLDSCAVHIIIQCNLHAALYQAIQTHGELPVRGEHHLIAPVRTVGHACTRSLHVPGRRHYSHPQAVPSSASVQVLSFPFDINRDTVDGVAEEMQEQFGLSATDRELAASAMREVISRQARLALLMRTMMRPSTGVFCTSFAPPYLRHLVSDAAAVCNIAQLWAHFHTECCSALQGICIVVRHYVGSARRGTSAVVPACSTLRGCCQVVNLHTITRHWWHGACSCRGWST